jgi:hypothetical protein
MFRLHETTRRRICRIAFLMLCVAPTFATAAWALHWHRPWRLRDESNRLGELLHVNASLDDWREPRPRQMRSAMVILASLASNKPLIELKNLTVHRRGDDSSITIADAEIEARRVKALGVQIAEWMACLAGDELNVSINRLSVVTRAGIRPVAFRDVQIRVARQGEKVIKAQMSARVDSHGSAPPLIRIVWEQTDANAGGVVRLTLDGGAASLPAWLFAEAVPSFGAFGPEAAFAGTIQAEYADELLSGIVRGRVEGIAIDGLLPTKSLHVAQGQANMTLDELRWTRKQIERMAGAVRVEHAKISRSLVAAANQRLYCPQAGPGNVAARGETEAADLLALDALACRFHLDQRGLTLAGDLPAQPSLPEGCLAVSGGRALMMQSPYLLPAGAWVQFATGHPSIAWAPATLEAEDILEHLPLPATGEQSMP